MVNQYFMKFKKCLVLVSLVALLSLISCKKEQTSGSDNVRTNTNSHPSLILTKQGVENIKAELGNIPIFDKTLSAAQAEIGLAIKEGFDVPIPKDYSGGYTHATHKRNYALMQKAGVLYQILEDEKYAKFVKEMLFEYAKMYPTLPIHPKPRSYARGKLFWQCLNDSNWLVYTSQAYDCIYDYLTKEERDLLENDLFRP